MKLVSLKLNEKFGILQAQEAKFVENPEGLIEIKAAVGEGKTTLKQATETAISAGNRQQLPFDTEKLKNIDVEIELSTGIFMRTYTDKNGDLKSIAYRKLSDGKIDRDPVIDGKKLTPAVLRDLLRTELTFGVDDFLSENPRTHMEFMMKIYSHKLSKLGVVFDKKSPDFEGSILWELEQAKMDRQNKHFKRREINGFKDALTEEGYDEDNIPQRVNIEELEAQKLKLINDNKKSHDEAVKAYYDKKQALQNQLNEITGKARDSVNVCINYNNTIDAQRQIKESEENKKKEKIDSALKLLSELKSLGYSGSEVQTWISSLPIPIEVKINTIPFDSEGKLLKEAFNQSWSIQVDEALKSIIELRKEGATVNGDISKLIEPEFKQVITDEIDSRIEVAKQTNKIIDRWNAFFDWSEADEKVKDIWKKYCAKFSEIDLGVPGLSILVVGDEEKSEIRTHYNGEHNPTFFGNQNKEYRLLTQYSATQRPVIAILMQLYLLSQKEDGLRMMWIEAPMDKKTRDLLIDIQKKNDITIIAGVTGDYTVEGLKQGEFLIQNGELLTLK